MSVSHGLTHTDNPSTQLNIICRPRPSLPFVLPLSLSLPPLSSLFGPKRKMTSAIARWHSNARPPSDALEQSYADQLEAEMQEMAIQLHKVPATEPPDLAGVIEALPRTALPCSNSSSNNINRSPLLFFFSFSFHILTESYYISHFKLRASSFD